MLPKKPLEALRDGAGADIELLIGTNAEEMNFYFVPTKVKQKIPAWLAKWMLGKSHPTARATLRAYGLGTPGKRSGEAFTDAMNDLVFRWPARRFAEEHRGRTHVYEFDWRSPAFDGGLGAAHGMELPFVFKTLSSVTGAQGLVGENPPVELAEQVHNIWVGFATDGTLAVARIRPRAPQRPSASCRHDHRRSRRCQPRNSCREPVLDQFRLDGRVAFVTGGAQGIGLAIAEALAEAGATVTIGDLTKPHSERRRVS